MIHVVTFDSPCDRARAGVKYETVGVDVGTAPPPSYFHLGVSLKCVKQKGQASAYI